MKISNYIRYLLRKWDKSGYSAFSINVGNCDSFAQELQDRFPRGRAMWGEDYPEYFNGEVISGHCFFKYGKKFYDSESPKGTITPYDLKYYQRAVKKN